MFPGGRGVYDTLTLRNFELSYWGQVSTILGSNLSGTSYLVGVGIFARGKGLKLFRDDDR